MKIDDDKLLNENQKQALNFREGVCLVLAGPGSGKTEILTRRIADIIHKTPTETFSILGLTFTNKAKDEMRNRINNFLDEDDDRSRVELHTFHSFCTDTLKQHGNHVGIKPNFSIITEETERFSLLKEAISNLELSGRYLENMDRLRREIDSLYLSYEKLKCDDTTSLKVYLSIFEEYLTLQKKYNMLDFQALLYYTKMLLTEQKNVRDYLQIIYEYVCVDEFQDTTETQYEILKLIAPPEKPANLFVVADDDQIIYEWNGANFKRFLDLGNAYELTIIQLPDNYRCPPEIVNTANLLISNNNQRITQKIPNAPTKKRGSKSAITIIKYSTFEDELAGLKNQLDMMSKSERNNCLIIARNNALLKSAEKWLISNEINAKVITRKQDFSGAFFQLLYYCLKLVNNPESQYVVNKLYNIANTLTDSNHQPKNILYQKLDVTESNLTTFFNQFKNCDLLSNITTLGLNKLCVERPDFRSFINEYITLCDDIPDINKIDIDFADDKQGWENIYEKWGELNSDNPTLYSLMQSLDLSEKNPPLEPDCIRLQTVHTSKGLEAQRVYIIGMAQEIFPTYLAIKNGFKAIEEERRNCFVAITRASEFLYISYAKNYFGYNKLPSSFLEEMKLI
ncbi:MAG: ATP-dependent helicase [Candidatus Cloacimonadaceae bacterium]